MPVSTLSVIAPNALDEFQDLKSVPNHRHFGKNPIVDRLKLAVPFDYIAISGLDVDRYRVGHGFSIDTDLPPAFLEAYDADRMFMLDPFVQAAKSSHSVVVEAEVYAEHSPPERLVYLARTFGIHNRTIFPILRNDVVYGAVCLCRTTPFTEDEILFVSLIAEAIHTAVTKPLMDRFAAEHLRLTKGELACLAQASLGLTSEAIGQQTGYQVETVNSYIKSATKKLGAANRTQAIAEAIRRRFID
ncbi:helix-turn-helix transcriptional regulator [Agrobacterium rubi]|uniref:LuxR family transcriptional regulator n=1 Tax=Agrobacterium rubi TaxID=28099 RepID=A0AAE7R546_9HYPH|nr:LuxR family transcriptional regulator [Agrobacterium rubi]NTE87916.1 LuxR family transcriptional regulator [Agrobacterium rubi]NTF03683.1 LuxR family transcriptional regulator [Agrobacterium rubi]NTF38009.1 LuxR family transcriptional regulator [Agrobacterium rubi]OCJ43535.1 DNA-binding protein [Agrobacterium rubi]QTG02070.1 LuxR family transcriptional regulator [Agrobacterium rubi]